MPPKPNGRSSRMVPVSPSVPVNRPQTRQPSATDSRGRLGHRRTARAAPITRRLQPTGTPDSRVHAVNPAALLDTPTCDFLLLYARPSSEPRAAAQRRYSRGWEPVAAWLWRRLPGRGARRRKLFRCALRACRPGLRRSAGSAILRGSPSSTDRLPAPRFRCSRGPAQRPLHSTAVVQLEVDMSSMMGLQSISGAFCTSP